LKPRLTHLVVSAAFLAACGGNLNNGGPNGPGGDGSSGGPDAGFSQNHDGSTTTGDGHHSTTCSNPLDKAGCTCSSSNATMPCYTGPSGTENVGACKDGTETCNTSATSEFPTWSMCTGQTLPSSENCSDGIDNDCNGLTDCNDPACVGTPSCTNTNNCIPPNEVGPDDTRCPAGYFIDPTNLLGYCCPCTANSCNNPSNFGADAACCAAPVCAGAATCGGLTCSPLPSSCGGQVDSDCDDYPEDCDQPCCPCAPSACPVPSCARPCTQDSDCCAGNTCDTTAGKCD
jgi:hypothetical protein